MTVWLALGRRVRDDVWQRRILAATAAALAVIYVAGVLSSNRTHGSLVKGDARSYFAFLPSLVLDHDVDLRNQFAVLHPEGDTSYPFGISRRGMAATSFPVSPALLWLPGYLIGLAGDAVFAGSTFEFGYGIGAVLGAAIWSILLVGAAAEFTRRLVREFVGREQALAATAFAWLATPAIYYTGVTPLYSHAPAWFVVSLMLWLTWRASEDPDRVSWWAWSGFAAGWVAAVRLQDAPLLMIPVAVVAAVHFRTGKHRLAAWTAWLGAAALGYLPQALTWHTLEGAWLPWDGLGEPKSPTLSEFAGVLFSTGYRGWISWTPIVLPGLIGLTVTAVNGPSPRARRFAGAALAGVAGMILLDLIHPFGAGAAFGGRRYVSVTPLIALGLGTLLGMSARRSKTAVWTLLSALAVWNICLIASYELLTRRGFYPTLLQAARHAIGLGTS